VRDDERVAGGAGPVFQLPLRDGETEPGGNGRGGIDLRGEVRGRHVECASRAVSERAGAADAGGGGEFREAAC